MPVSDSGPWRSIFRVISFLAVLYLFFISIDLMSSAFKMFGKDFTDRLIGTASDPLAGLIIGFLTTSLIQSSSTTTSIIVDIERIGDFTKNIVELAKELPEAFKAVEIDEDITKIETTVTSMFETIIPALESSDSESARRIYADHESVVELVESNLRLLLVGNIISGSCGTAVVAALYIRYLKRISAHIKNIATSIINPYYRLGFREKSKATPEKWGT